MIGNDVLKGLVAAASIAALYHFVGLSVTIAVVAFLVVCHWADLVAGKWQEAKAEEREAKRQEERNNRHAAHLKRQYEEERRRTLEEAEARYQRRKAQAAGEPES